MVERRQAIIQNYQLANYKDGDKGRGGKIPLIKQDDDLVDLSKQGETKRKGETMKM